MASRPLLPIVTSYPVYNEGANFKALWSEIAVEHSRPRSMRSWYMTSMQDNTLPVVAEVIAAGETRIAAAQEPLWKRRDRSH